MRITVEFKHDSMNHLKRLYRWLDTRDWSGYSLDMSHDFQTRYYTFSNAAEAERFNKRWGKR